MISFDFLKGRVMGPLFALVCTYFGKNVIVTCKIVSFMYSLDNFFLKNLIVFIFGNQISKWRSFEKGLFLTYFSHFLVTREKTQKFFQYISHLQKYAYLAQPIGFFCLTDVAKIKNLSFIVSLWCDSWC